MINPFTVPGWNLNRYMLSTAVAGVSTLFALVLPAAALAGLSGPTSVAIAGYSVLALAVVVQLCRLGASNLGMAGGRRACLAVLEAVLWTVAVLSLPVLAFDIVRLESARTLGARHAFAVAAVVFGVLSAAAGINLAFLLRSSLWASFRAFVLEPRSGDKPSSIAP